MEENGKVKVVRNFGKLNFAKANPAKWRELGKWSEGMVELLLTGWKSALRRRQQKSGLRSLSPIRSLSFISFDSN